jgi:8-oxo-dGTP pyrophosphatase MutT (NUDIX family)
MALIRKSAAVLVPRGDGTFAAIRSRKHGGSLELPGGKSTTGESDVETARREAYEEIGPVVDSSAPLVLIGVFSHVAQDGSFWDCAVFVGRYNGGSLRSSDEGEAVWATRESLMAGTYADLNVDIFAAYDARIAASLDGR